VRVRELVALDLASANEVIRHVRREWDAGNAVLVVDQRLPIQTRKNLMLRLGAHAVVESAGRSAFDTRAEPMLEGDALVVATSGTSGDPKGVVHTHDGLLAASLATSAALGAGAEAHWLACLPLAHVGGFGVVTRAWHTGATLTVHDAFDADAVASSGASHVSLVATTLARVDANAFHRILLGGARPPSTVPDNVTVTYGLTESCGGVVYDRRPIPGVSVEIAPDGEILLRGPMIMSRYRGTNHTTTVDDEGWLHTNDAGRFDDGLLHVDGRRGDMIITGGENVWPDAVERVLNDHPHIAECAVAGVPDTEWGERVVAWIVPSRDQKPSLENVRDFVAQTLPRHCAPGQLVVVDSLPRTSLGKVVRRALVEALASQR
jgi:O-succinylbenzoic acid--CoA ligase